MKLLDSNTPRETFNLEKAIAGRRIITRDHWEVEISGLSRLTDRAHKNTPITGVVCGRLGKYWTEDGRRNPDPTKPSDWDIFLIVES